MVSKYACDFSFCKSKGTLIFANNFIEKETFDIEFYVKRYQDKILKKDVNIKEFKNYIIIILYALFNPKVKWLSLNNLPILSLNKNNVLLLHNVFYTYSIFELIKLGSIISLPFYLKWLYFRFFLKVFPPKKIYVQTKFMKKRVRKFYSNKIKIIPQSYLYNNIKEYTKISKCSNYSSLDEEYIFFIGGTEPHKMVRETINYLLKKKWNKKINFLIIGNFQVNDFICNENVNLIVKQEISHNLYLQIIKDSLFCIISSAHESLCIPLLECKILNKEYLVFNSEYSRELSEDNHIYLDHIDLFTKMETYLL